MLLRLVFIGCWVIFALTAVDARAQTYSVQSIQAANVGRVVSAPAGQGDTVFRFTANGGVVTKVSGNGARLDTTTTRATVTLQCSNSASCPNAVTITVTPGAATRRARALTNLTVSSGTATVGTVTAAPSGGISFSVTGIPQKSTGTFFIGADLGVADDASAGGTGDATAAFTVATPTASLASSVAVRALRQITVTAGDTLEFGRILRPRVGTNTVTINATTGARSITGAGNGALMTSTTRRATFTVGGEGAQTFSITAGPILTMTGDKGGTIAANLVPSAATGTLTSTLGTAGTASFGVGGSFELNANTVQGNYTGTFQVTVAYN